MKTPGTNYSLLRVAMLIAPFGIVDGANAACAPASPANNVTVTCAGATANQNGSDGYGTNTDIGNTYNDRSKRRTDLQYLGNGQQFRNYYRGTGDNGGILSVGNGTVNNTGVISGAGANSFGILFFGTGFVTNSGSISGVGKGVFLQNGEVTNTSTGAISSGRNGIQATTTATVNNAGHILGATGSGIVADIAVVTNDSSGVISGFLTGIMATTTANVNNAGSISASGSGGGGIRSAGSAVVTNGGTISALETGIGSDGSAVGTNTYDIRGRRVGHWDRGHRCHGHQFRRHLGRTPRHRGLGGLAA